MERVTGIGGIFFRAEDPQASARWYAEHLGVDEVPTRYGGQAWETEAGVTVFAPLPADSDYFRRSSSRSQPNPSPTRRTTEGYAAW